MTEPGSPPIALIARALVALATASASFGCEASPPADLGAAAARTGVVTIEPPPNASEPPKGRASTESQCPDSMQWVSGSSGEYWAGHRREGGNDEEHPSYRTQVHGFCLDRTEVTTAAYQQCFDDGNCTSAAHPPLTCNFARPKREEHPINCVVWEQAMAYCRSVDKRLPTEREWEYAAQGGTEYRRFSWGREHPDGQTCWKTNGTCPVGTHTVGAFGLHDMNGNVWEWTDNYFGKYPWPSQWSHHKVYRGGSWSRRFPKWMSLTLRNRFSPAKRGSHLGFRCAQLPTEPNCPYGIEERAGAVFCRHGVEDSECPRGQSWNDLRCTETGGRECPWGMVALDGYGCVLKGGPVKIGGESNVDQSVGVRAKRQKRYDSDCRRFAHNKPRAFRFVGGTHHGRNIVARKRGCKNRDVGVGWNSACCPR